MKVSQWWIANGPGHLLSSTTRGQWHHCVARVDVYPSLLTDYKKKNIKNNQKKMDMCSCKGSGCKYMMCIIPLANLGSLCGTLLLISPAWTGVIKIEPRAFNFCCLTFSCLQVSDDWRIPSELYFAGLRTTELPFPKEPTSGIQSGDSCSPPLSFLMVILWWKIARMRIPCR